jgi:hypothetical protein
MANGRRSVQITFRQREVGFGVTRCDERSFKPIAVSMPNALAPFRH